MSAKTGLSVGELHASHKRLVQSGLIWADSRQPMPLAVREFLVHGLRYVFPARYGGRARGMVTMGGAPPLSHCMAGVEEETVWPWEPGLVVGQVMDPLYESVPQACAGDAVLYEWLALCDSLRAGRAREKNLAGAEVASRLGLRA